MTHAPCRLSRKRVNWLALTRSERRPQCPAAARSVCDRHKHFNRNGDEVAEHLKQEISAARRRRREQPEHDERRIRL
jgi:hypothetical protein